MPEAGVSDPDLIAHGEAVGAAEAHVQDVGIAREFPQRQDDVGDTHAGDDGLAVASLDRSDGKGQLELSFGCDYEETVAHAARCAFLPVAFSHRARITSQ